MDPSRWRRIQEVFYDASELDPAARAAYLDGACAGDLSLRAEVEAFLESLEQQPDDPLARAISAEAASLLAPDETSVAGRSAGPYRLVRKIGQGGMGAVFLAERADQQYDRQVAIKLAPPDVAGSAGRMLRFRMERQILANLDHPNIAHMLDGGVTEDGVPYLVMEYVDGLPIDEYCRANPMPLRRLVELFTTVCRAVEYAHRNMVIHRDIKPSNILVTSDGIPKLLDFGIAKLIAPGAAGVTVQAERLMTLAYASPEQLLGMPITTATDVFALGVVFWELLTGQLLFEGSRAIEVAPPSGAVADAAEARAMRGDLDQVVLKALSREPEARYSSVEQLEQDLRRYLDGFPVLARRGSALDRAAKFVRRHRGWVAAAATFVLMLAGFGIGMSALAARAARERDAARDERARAEIVSGFLSNLFGSSDPYRSAGSTVSAKDLLDHGVGRIESDLASQPRVRAQLLETMARAYQHLGLQEQAEDLFRRQARAEEQTWGASSIAVARALRQLGDVERQRSRLSDAEADLRRALAIVRNSPGEDLEMAHTVNNLGLVMQARGRLEEAQRLFEQAVATMGRHPDQATEILAMRSNLGSILGERGDYARAEALLRDVLSRRRELLGSDHPQVFLSTLRLGRLLERRGSLTEAEALYRAALAGDRRVAGEEHPETLAAMNNLASLLQHKGELAEAEALYRRAIEIGTRTLGDHADVALWRSNLAGLLTAAGRYPEADRLFRESIALCHENMGPDSTREAGMLRNYAILLERTGRRGDALRCLRTSLAILRQALGENHPAAAAVRLALTALEGQESAASRR